MIYHRYLRLILKRLWLIILLEAVMLGGVYFYIDNQPLHYAASTTLLLNPNVPTALLSYVQNNVASSLAENYNLIIKSDKFLTELQARLPFKPDKSELRKSLTSQLTANTLAYAITANATSPTQAQQIANQTAQLLIENATIKVEPQKETSAKDQEVEAALKDQNEQVNRINQEISRLKNRLTELSQLPVTTENQNQVRELRTQLRDNTEVRSRLVVALSELETKNTIIVETPNPIVVLDPASVPTASLDNFLTIGLISAGLLALTLGLGLIVLLDYLDFTVKSAAELEELAGLSNLGSIALFQPIKNSETTPGKLEGLDTRLVTLRDFQSPVSEAYRTIRTNLIFSSMDNKAEDLKTGLDEKLDPRQLVYNGKFKSLLVTSVNPGEGKSLSSANLAIAFAQAGANVVLIDGDLRQPSLHRLFNLDNSFGFSNLVLFGPGRLKEAVKKTPLPNLLVIPAGTLPPNPSELLTSEKSDLIIKELSTHADIVIIDSPPAGLVTDVAILARRVDRVILVVQWGKTRRDAISRTIKQFKKVRSNFAGTLLNKAKNEGLGSYYYKNYSYYGKGANKTEPSQPKVEV